MLRKEELQKVMLEVSESTQTYFKTADKLKKNLFPEHLRIMPGDAAEKRLWAVMT